MLGARRIIVGHGPAVAGLAITAVLSGFAEAGILAAVAQVGSALVYHGKTVNLELGPVSVSPGVGTMLVFAAALAILRIALLAYNSHLQARLAADVQTTLRAELFATFTRSPWDLQSTEREGHLQEMLTGQVIQATTGTLQFASMVSSLITFSVLVLSAMLLDFVVAIAVVVVALALFGALRPLSSFGRRSAKQLSRSQLDFASGVGEAVRLTEETHVFGVDDAQRRRVDSLVDEAGRLFFQTQFVTRIVPNLFQSLVYLTVIAGLALLYATDAGDVASLGAVILIMVRAGSYGQQVQNSYQAILQSLPFAEALQGEVARYSAARVIEPPGRLERIDTLAMDAVAYAYREGEAVLSDISFEAHRGEAVGIVGPSGAGKSTLVQIMLRLREPQSGEYAINGVPASTLSFADWHRRVAYVPQKPQLLHATVADNIRFFRDIDEADVVRAAELARIDTDIRGWRGGYETMIGPRADSISGGQQQRICLARALASRPDVLVLDEPTSALDPRSEILIQESLGTIAEDLTLFVVTHRMGLLGVCDRLLVIVDGRVDDFGRTDEVRTANAYLAAI